MLFTPLVIFWPLLVFLEIISGIKQIKKESHSFAFNFLEVFTILLGNISCLYIYITFINDMKLNSIVAKLFYTIGILVSVIMFISSFNVTFKYLIRNISRILFTVIPFISFLILWILGVVIEK